MTSPYREAVMIVDHDRDLLRERVAKRYRIHRNTGTYPGQKWSVQRRWFLFWVEQDHFSDAAAAIHFAHALIDDEIAGIKYDLLSL